MGVACRENPEALGPKSALTTLGVKETAEERGKKILLLFYVLWD